jgi:hypothetical protein
MSRLRLEVVALVLQFVLVDRQPQERRRPAVARDEVQGQRRLIVGVEIGPVHRHADRLAPSPEADIGPSAVRAAGERQRPLTGGEIVDCTAGALLLEQLPYCEILRSTPLRRSRPTRALPSKRQSLRHGSLLRPSLARSCSIAFSRTKTQVNVERNEFAEPDIASPTANGASN